MRRLCNADIEEQIDPGMCLPSVCGSWLFLWPSYTYIMCMVGSEEDKTFGKGARVLLKQPAFIYTDYPLGPSEGRDGSDGDDQDDLVQYAGTIHCRC